MVQFSVKHEQEIDCGGGYVKVFSSDLDQKSMHGDSAYHIMFGPDICGYSTKKVHVIFNYKGKNLLTKKEIRCKVNACNLPVCSVMNLTTEVFTVHIFMTSDSLLLVAF